MKEKIKEYIYAHIRQTVEEFYVNWSINYNNSALEINSRQAQIVNEICQFVDMLFFAVCFCHLRPSLEVYKQHRTFLTGWTNLCSSGMEDAKHTNEDNGGMFCH